jgi:hypothetical protein
MATAYTNFDRYKHMDEQTRSSILHCIRDIDDVDSDESDVIFRKHFELKNKLYGLFDGYLYSDIIQVAETSQLPDDVLTKIKELVTTIETYSKI